MVEVVGGVGDLAVFGGPVSDSVTNGIIFVVVIGLGRAVSEFRLDLAKGVILVLGMGLATIVLRVGEAGAGDLGAATEFVVAVGVPGNRLALVVGFSIDAMRCRSGVYL